MAIFQKLFGRKSTAPKNGGMIDAATFNDRLDKHMEDMQVDLSSPATIKIAILIVLSVKAARVATGYKPVDADTQFNECNGLVIVIQEGIREFVSAKNPELSEAASEFKADVAGVLAMSANKVFEFESPNPDERMRGILNMGMKAKIRTQEENPEILQQISRRWGEVFKDYSVENVTALGETYREVVDWLNKRKMT